MKCFETGKTYFCRCASDHSIIYSVKIESRTEKTVRISGYLNKRCRIKVRNDVEFVVPERYAFAPVFFADSVHEEEV